MFWTRIDPIQRVIIAQTLLDGAAYLFRALIPISFSDMIRLITVTNTGIRIRITPNDEDREGHQDAYIVNSMFNDDAMIRGLQSVESASCESKILRYELERLAPKTSRDRARQLVQFRVSRRDKLGRSLAISILINKDHRLEDNIFSILSKMMPFSAHTEAELDNIVSSVGDEGMRHSLTGREIEGVTKDVARRRLAPLTSELIAAAYDTVGMQNKDRRRFDVITCYYEKQEGAAAKLSCLALSEDAEALVNIITPSHIQEGVVSFHDLGAEKPNERHVAICVPVHIGGCPWAGIVRTIRMPQTSDDSALDNEETLANEAMLFYREIGMSYAQRLRGQFRSAFFSIYQREISEFSVTREGLFNDAVLLSLFPYSVYAPISREAIGRDDPASWTWRSCSSSLSLQQVDYDKLTAAEFQAARNEATKKPIIAEFSAAQSAAFSNRSHTVQRLMSMYAIDALQDLIVDYGGYAISKDDEVDMETVMAIKRPKDDDGKYKNRCHIASAINSVKLQFCVSQSFFALEKATRVNNYDSVKSQVKYGIKPLLLKAAKFVNEVQISNSGKAHLKLKFAATHGNVDVAKDVEIGCISSSILFGLFVELLVNSIRYARRIGSVVAVNAEVAHEASARIIRLTNQIDQSHSRSPNPYSFFRFWGSQLASNEELSRLVTVSDDSPQANDGVFCARIVVKMPVAQVEGV